MRFLSAIFFAVLVAPLLAPGPVFAEDPVSVGNIRIIHPWARASAGPMRNGAAFLEIRNTGSEPDRLIGVESPAAGRAHIHETFMEGDVIKMRPIDTLEIPGGGSVVLKPHGLHIMLMMLNAPLKRGENLLLTLRFEKSGSIRITLPISAPGAIEPPG